MAAVSETMAKQLFRMTCSLYNNHSKKAVTTSRTVRLPPLPLAPTGRGWELDGYPDCYDFVPAGMTTMKPPAGTPMRGAKRIYMDLVAPSLLTPAPCPSRPHTAARQPDRLQKRRSVNCCRATMLPCSPLSSRWMMMPSPRSTTNGAVSRSQPAGILHPEKRREHHALEPARRHRLYHHRNRSGRLDPAESQPCRDQALCPRTTPPRSSLPT